LSKVKKMQKAGIIPDPIEIQTAFLAVGSYVTAFASFRAQTNREKLKTDASKNTKKG